MKIRAGGGSIRAGGGSFRAAGCSPLLFLFMGNTNVSRSLVKSVYRSLVKSVYKKILFFFSHPEHYVVGTQKKISKFMHVQGK